MKKSDTEQEQPGLEENKVPDSQSKRELDRELQELAENERQEEIYYEERRRERHERNLKRKKRQIRNRNLALIITALAVLGGVGYFYREQTGLKDGMETLVAKVRDLVPDKNSGKESKAAEELAKADQSTESIENPESTENPDINTEEAADSSDSTDIQPESGEGTADDSDETTGNTDDNSEDTAQDKSGNMSDKEKTEDNSSDSANQPEQEAAQTAEYFGTHVERIYDVGVSGMHRLFSRLDTIQEANCVVAVAGMEGALASVMGGLVKRPVIAVPTSVGYGASFHGLSALLTMINSCANGIAVVNIDNGFGAGYLATQINRLAEGK